MILQKITVEKFKKIDKVELDLAPLNILVGTNGSGKSSILQAIHLASCLIRQAERVDQTKTSPVGIENLDYLPTNDYSMLGNLSSWGNQQGSSSSKVRFDFLKLDGEARFAHCEIRSARNAGISITGHVQPDLLSLMRTKTNFFSAYIPGISGVPNREEKRSKKVIFKTCSFGDSNVILRNVLLLLKQEDKISLLEEWIEQVIGKVRIDVQHEDQNDIAIRCNFTMNGDTRPIELIGTGYLQLIQIFSYILLFGPGILLVDEPDIHLHPSVQEKLVRVLAQVANELKLRIILTTHSPFIVRGAPIDAKVFWIKDGKVADSSRSEVELALGWGCFGKKVLLISEDTNTNLLQKLLSQWPEIERQVSILPGNGYKNLPTPAQASEMSAVLGGKFKIVVHRDRDSLTDDEAKKLQASYLEKGIHLWLTEHADIEAYFCQPIFLAELLGCSMTDAQGYIDHILSTHQVPIKEMFFAQRAKHNQEIYPQGGSPTNHDVWTLLEARPFKGAKGKFVFNKLKDTVSAGRFSATKVDAHIIQDEIADDLKTKLTELVAD